MLGYNAYRVISKADIRKQRTWKHTAIKLGVVCTLFVLLMMAAQLFPTLSSPTRLRKLQESDECDGSVLPPRLPSSPPDWTRNLTYANIYKITASCQMEDISTIYGYTIVMWVLHAGDYTWPVYVFYPLSLALYRANEIR